MSKIYKILCSNCNVHLYHYTGTFRGVIKMAHFVPVNGSIPTPAPKQHIICPKCGQAPYLVNSRGSIYFLTEDGIKPRPPDGKKEVFIYPEEYVFHHETPRSLKDGGSDYIEETPPKLRKPND